MDINKLWKMYEEAAIKEVHLRNLEKEEKNYFTTVDAINQNGICSGILQCIKELEGDPSKTMYKAYRIFSKVRGVDIDTGFGFWIPVSERLPEKGSNVIACFDDGFITGVEFEEDGEWGLWADSGDVVAWMPLPEPYEKK